LREILDRATLRNWSETCFATAAWAQLQGARSTHQRAKRRSWNARARAAVRPEFDADGRLLDSGGRWDDDLGRFDITGVLREALEDIDDRTRAAFVLRDLLELSADPSRARWGRAAFTAASALQ